RGDGNRDKRTMRSGYLLGDAIEKIHAAPPFTIEYSEAEFFQSTPNKHHLRQQPFVRSADGDTLVQPRRGPGHIFQRTACLIGEMIHALLAGGCTSLSNPFAHPRYS